jgi:hypothetical protein
MDGKLVWSVAVSATDPHHATASYRTIHPDQNDQNG